MLLLLGNLVAMAACAEPTNSSDLRRALDVAEQTAMAGDPARFEAGVREVRQALRCLREPVASDVVEELHRLHGAQLLSEGRQREALPYLVAGGVAPESIEPEVAVALRTWVVRRGSRLPPPLRGRLLVDGQAADLRPAAGAPYLVQHLVGERVTSTSYVLPGAPPPSYPRLRRYLVGAAGVSAVLAVGSALGAQGERNKLVADRQEPYTRADLDALKARNNRFVVGAAGASTITLICLGTVGVSYVW